MLRYFYRGALHGLILGMVGCGIIAVGLHGLPRSEAGGLAKAATDTASQRHAQKVFPIMSSTGP